ncbi:hypothetical protein ILP97_12075 [Amycolatopsis sp. H6(2020)]|nr:hypothetical protein [Amycolatopsis sp. H6(2020)]
MRERNSRHDARAAGRPFAWLDDETTDADHHPGPALPHPVEASTGQELTTWLSTVA